MTIRQIAFSAAALSFALVLVQCSPAVPDGSSSSAPDNTSAAVSTSASVSVSSGPVATADTPYAFDVALSFTPAAAAKMAALHAQVTLEAMYYGDATPAAASKGDSAGQIDLGHDIDLLDASNQTVHFSGASLDASHMGDLAGGKPSMLINVSSLASGQDNVLNCDVFQDAVSAGQAQPVAIHCDVAG